MAQDKTKLDKKNQADQADIDSDFEADSSGVGSAGGSANYSGNAEMTDNSRKDKDFENEDK